MKYKILLITDDDVSANQLKVILESPAHEKFDVIQVKTLEAGIKKVSQCSINAIIADSVLKKSGSRNMYEQLLVIAPQTPLLVLVDTYADALSVMRQGAQSYIIKNNLDKDLIPKTLHNYISLTLSNQVSFNENTRAENALNSIGDAVLCTDLLGNIDYLNVAAEQMTGWKREEAKGRSISDVFRLINGVTREASPNMIDIVIKSDEPKVLEPNTLLVRRDGSEIHIEDSISPIHDWDGRLTGVVVVFHDASEAKISYYENGT